MTKRQARELHDRTANEDDSERDDDDDKVALDRRGAEAQEDTGPSRLLACPYYKRDRTKFKSRRSCPGPGWDSLRRVKSVTPPEPSATRRRHATRTANRIDRREHLYRRHRLEEFGCPRCHEHFKEERYLDAHKQADPPCEVRQPDLLAGLDHAQYCQLRSRKRTRGVSTLEDSGRKYTRFCSQARKRMIYPVRITIPTLRRATADLMTWKIEYGLSRGACGAGCHNTSGNCATRASSSVNETTTRTWRDWAGTSRDGRWRGFASRCLPYEVKVAVTLDRPILPSGRPGGICSQVPLPLSLPPRAAKALKQRLRSAT